MPVGFGATAAQPSVGTIKPLYRRASSIVGSVILPSVFRFLTPHYQLSRMNVYGNMPQNLHINIITTFWLCKDLRLYLLVICIGVQLYRIVAGSKNLSYSVSSVCGICRCSGVIGDGSCTNGIIDISLAIDTIQWGVRRQDCFIFIVFTIGGFLISSNITQRNAIYISS